MADRKWMTGHPISCLMYHIFKWSPLLPETFFLPKSGPEPKSHVSFMNHIGWSHYIFGKEMSPIPVPPFPQTQQKMIEFFMKCCENILWYEKANHNSIIFAATADCTSFFMCMIDVIHLPSAVAVWIDISTMNMVEITIIFSKQAIFPTT